MSDAAVVALVWQAQFIFPFFVVVDALYYAAVYFWCHRSVCQFGFAGRPSASSATLAYQPS